MLERADTLEAIGLIMFAPPLYSTSLCCGSDNLYGWKSLKNRLPAAGVVMVMLLREAFVVTE